MASNVKRQIQMAYTRIIELLALRALLHLLVFQSLMMRMSFLFVCEGVYLYIVILTKT